MEFSLRNSMNTMGMLTWGELKQTYPDRHYERIIGWKHNQSLKPKYLTPSFSPDTVMYDVKLLKASMTVFKALLIECLFLTVPGKEFPLLVVEDKDKWEDKDLVVVIAPRVDSDE